MASAAPIRFAFIALFFISSAFGLVKPAKAGFEWLPSEKTESKDKPEKKDIPRPVLRKIDKQSAPSGWGTMSSTTTQQQVQTMQVVKPQQQPVQPNYNHVVPQQQYIPPNQPVYNQVPQQQYIPPAQPVYQQQYIPPAQPVYNQAPVQQPPIQHVENKPFSAPAQVIENSYRTPQQPAAPAFFAEAVGFGSDMPLAFALRQVIPEGYTHSFGKNINLGARVSWNGGKPWNLVVQDMVMPLGLGVSIQGTKVFIHNASQPQPVYAPQPQIQQHPQHQAIQQQQPVHTAPPANASPANLVVQQGRTGIQDPGAYPSQQPRFSSSSNPNGVQFWQAHKGQNVRDILIEWSPKANVELSWQATENYRVAENVVINDTFNNALVRMFNENMQGGRVPLISFVNPTQAGMSSKLIVRDRNS